MQQDLQSRGSDILVATGRGRNAAPTRYGSKPPLPREHGAWGILLIPFATAVGVAGAWNLPVTLLLISILCFYTARTSFLKQNYRWTAILLAGSLAAALPLLFVWKLWWLAAFGAVALPVAFRKTTHNVWMQLFAVLGLTLTAPAAWYVLTGALDCRLWLLNTLYFAGGVVYVKMHIAAAMARRPAGRAPVVIYYAGLVAVLLALAASGVVSFWALAAYAPAVARAGVGVARLSPALRIKRLGWTEVAHSLVFAGLLIVTWR